MVLYFPAVLATAKQYIPPHVSCLASHAQSMSSSCHFFSSLLDLEAVDTEWGLQVHVKITRPLLNYSLHSTQLRQADISDTAV